MLSKYLQDYCFLKVLGYGDNKYIKLVQLKNVKNSGFEDVEQKIIDTDKSQNDFKLDEAISRARSKIFELAICNPWDYFFTGTLDKDKYDRADLSKFHKDFTKWLQNQLILLFKAKTFLLHGNADPISLILRLRT